MAFLIMEGTAWPKLVICIGLLVMASGSPFLLRLPGAEARGPFCCPRMVDCNSVCQGFPNRCVDCKCICDDDGGDDHTQTSPQPLPMAADMYMGNHQGRD